MEVLRKLRISLSELFDYAANGEEATLDGADVGIRRRINGVSGLLRLVVLPVLVANLEARPGMLIPTRWNRAHLPVFEFLDVFPHDAPGFADCFRRKPRQTIARITLGMKWA